MPERWRPERLGAELERMRLSRRGVLLAGLLVAGCSSGPQRPTIESVEGDSGGDPKLKRLKEILDRRAKAVLDKDEQAYLADLDPSATDLVEHEKMVFANLRQFEFSEFRYITERITTGDGDADENTFGPVIRVARLTADATSAGVSPAETFRYRLAQKDGTLVIAKIEPATRETQGRLSFHGPIADEPWNFTLLKVIQAGNVWLAADGSVKDLDRYAGVAEDEARKVEKLWGDRLRFPGHVLFLTRDAESFRKWYSFGSASNFLADLEGVAVPREGVRKNGEIYANQYAGSRVVVNLKSVSMFSGGDPRSVMRHELVHAITSRAAATPGTSFSGLGAPRWAIEGFATWATSMERPGDRSAERAAVAQGVSRGRFTGRLPTSKDFYSEDTSQRYFHYVLSASVFGYIEKIKGRDAAVEFYAQVVGHNDQEGTPFTELPAFDGICERVVGKSAAGFQQDWANFVRRGA